MKLFPSNIFTVAQNQDRKITLNKLKQKTKLTSYLVSEFTRKEFIGEVKDSSFKVISSEIGRGAFCVFVGDFQDATGTIEIRMHKVFQVMCSILMLMPTVGFGIMALTIGTINPIGALLLMLVGFVLVRFVFIELSFRFISKTGIEKLTRIIGLKIIEKE